MKKLKKITIATGVLGLIIGLIALFSARIGISSAEEKPQNGGILTYAFQYQPSNFDAHRESTIAVVEPLAPHYSLLLKVDPGNYPNVVGDLAESWAVSRDQKTYTFNILKGVKFHDGSLLTAKDVKASYDKIIFPPPGVISPRQAFYSIVEKVEVPDSHTVVFRLKRPSASFLSSLASPFNNIYKADILAKDPRWYEKNIMGTGPFKFVEYVAGSHWVGKRNEDFFVKGRPYLDGFRIIFIADSGARAAAVRSGRVHTEFIAFTPPQRDDIVRALGDKVRVQETSSTSSRMIIFNSEKKPFDDPRVRRALTLSLDRWEGSRVLYRISNIKELGGLLRPGSEFAMNAGELAQVAGFSKDIESSRKEARRLFREAGIPEGFSFDLKNRSGGSRDYEGVAVWAIDQWRKVGLNVTQKLQEVGSLFSDLRSGNFEMVVHSTSDYLDEPDLEFIKYISSDKSPANYGRYKDRILDDLYGKQSIAVDPGERKKICYQFEKRVLDEMAYVCMTPWRHRIVVHSSKMKGWKALPSHFLNLDLRDVWLDKD
jgi:peptide/nickel transport system substrate-binding protein